jgi:hypothetical protein
MVGGCWVLIPTGGRKNEGLNEGLGCVSYANLQVLRCHPCACKFFTASRKPDRWHSQSCAETPSTGRSSSRQLCCTQARRWERWTRSAGGMRLVGSCECAASGCGDNRARSSDCRVAQQRRDLPNAHERHTFHILQRLPEAKNVSVIEDDCPNRTLL